MCRPHVYWGIFPQEGFFHKATPSSVQKATLASAANGITHSQLLINELLTIHFHAQSCGK